MLSDVSPFDFCLFVCFFFCLWMNMADFACSPHLLFHWHRWQPQSFRLSDHWTRSDFLKYLQFFISDGCSSWCCCWCCLVVVCFFFSLSCLCGRMCYVCVIFLFIFSCFLLIYFCQKKARLFGSDGNEIFRFCIFANRCDKCLSCILMISLCLIVLRTHKLPPPCVIRFCLSPTPHNNVFVLRRYKRKTQTKQTKKKKIKTTRLSLFNLTPTPKFNRHKKTT